MLNEKFKMQNQGRHGAVSGAGVGASEAGASQSSAFPGGSLGTREKLKAKQLGHEPAC